MIAIPNMEKPKRCKECSFKTCFIRVNLKSYTCLINGGECGKTDCPLIDIVKCGECKWWNRDGKRKDGKGWCENAICGLTKPNAFCSYGERRADGDI